MKEGYHTKEKEPWIYDIVRELLNEQVKIEVDNYMTSHKNEFNGILKDVIEKGIAECFVNNFKSYFQQQFLLLIHY